MSTVRIELPPEIVDIYGSEAGARRGAKVAVVLDLVRQGKLSRQKGAELLSLSPTQLRELLSQYRIPWFDYSDEELQEDLRTLQAEGDLRE